jgi:DNA polymerase I
MLASGRTSWSIGERVRVYRTTNGAGGVVAELDGETAAAGSADRRDYDVDHYVRLLHDTFAARLARAFAPGDFAAIFADPDQLSLFPPSIEAMHTILTRQSGIS